MVIFIFDDVYNNYFWHWLILNVTADIIYVLDILISTRKGKIHWSIRKKKGNNSVYMFDGLEVKSSRMMWRNYQMDPAPLLGSVIIRGREVKSYPFMAIISLYFSLEDGFSSISSAYFLWMSF